MSSFRVTFYCGILALLREVSLVHYFSKTIVPVILGSLILEGCAGHPPISDKESFLTSDPRELISMKDNTGRVVFEKDYEGKKLELMLSPPMQVKTLPNAEKYISIIFSYADFSITQAQEEAILEISFINNDGRKEKILLKREAGAVSEIAKLQEEAKGCKIPVTFMEMFSLLKEDFHKVAKASSVHYLLKTPLQEFEGDLPSSLIEDLERNKDIYIGFTPWGMQERSLKEMEEEAGNAIIELFEPSFSTLK